MKRAIWLLITLCFGLVAWLASLESAALYHRDNSQKVLAQVRFLKPGVTTEADYVRAMRPLVVPSSHERYESSCEASVASYSFTSSNEPYWAGRFVTWLANSRFIAQHFLLDEMLFQMEVKFRDGVLQEVFVLEFDCPPSCGHPFASTTRYGTREDVADLTSFDRLPDKPFDGYLVETRMIQDEVVTHRSEPVLFVQRVYLDDRATAAQVKSAFDFRLECFTALIACRNAGELLRPLPNR